VTSQEGAGAPANEPAREGMLVWRYGVELRADPQLQRDSGWSRANLRKHGLRPATLIDVGVGHGTPELYAAFPEAHHVLLEPLQEFEGSLRSHIRERGGEYMLAAVGSENGEVEIRVDKEIPWMSSVIESVGREQSFDVRRVPMRTLDSLMDERGWNAPFGLKIDTEGFEEEVVAGAERLLEQTQFVIAEVSVMRRYAEGGRLAEFVEAMARRGFILYDILDAQKPDPAGPIYFMDVLFRREDELPY
jgi:FkbM family methyltransferase